MFLFFFFCDIIFISVIGQQPPKKKKKKNKEQTNGNSNLSVNTDADVTMKSEQDSILTEGKYNKLYYLIQCLPQGFLLCK